MPTVEITRVFTKDSLLRTTHNTLTAKLCGAAKIGIDALGDIAAGDIRTVLRSLKTQVDGKAAEDHNHSADDINSGTIPVDRIGTGTKNSTTVYYGDGTFKTPATGGVTASAMQEYKAGLLITWNPPATNASHISVTTGSCYIPASDKIVPSPSSLSCPAMTFAPSTTYYIYAFESAGVLALDLPSTTAPAAPYRGAARTKTPDTTRRYIGAIRTNADATPRVLNVQRVGNFVRYLEDPEAAPLVRVSSGTATVDTVFDCSPVVPPTSRMALLIAFSPSGGPYVELGSSNDSATNKTIRVHGFGGYTPVTMHLNDAQQAHYRNIHSTNAATFICVIGYWEDV